MVRRNALRWYRWLRSVGMPTDHIAILLDLDPTEVDWLLAYRSRWHRPPKMPAACDARGSIYERPILNDTGPKIVRLAGLGYDPRRIAEILLIRPERVVDWLRRTAPTRTTPLLRPRTKDQQQRVDAERRRRERRRAKAAKAAAELAARIVRAGRLDDAGCTPLPLVIVPPAAELVDGQVAELAPAAPIVPPTAPTRWHGRIDPRGLRDAPLAAPVAAPDEPPSNEKRARPGRWKPAATEPRLFARGSAARYDDVGIAPLPAPIDEPIAAARAIELPPPNYWHGDYDPGRES
jgi:hypothetical protein